MKKIFLSLGFCFCLIGVGFGAWKFQVHKKLPLPWFHDRTPASIEETVSVEHSEDPVEQAEQAEEAAKPVVKEDFKIQLHKIEKNEISKKSVKHEPEHIKKKEDVKMVQEDKKSEKHAVTHMITKDETAWFLANVYYGKGPEFTKILSANGFKSPEELKEGMEIQIPSPKFHKGQSGFAAHYSEVWEKRAKALKDRNKDVEADKYLTQAPIPSSKVVIPTEKIRAKDKTPQFPFTEVKEAQPTPAEKAKEALRQSHEQHGE